MESGPTPHLEGSMVIMRPRFFYLEILNEQDL